MAAASASGQMLGSALEMLQRNQEEILSAERQRLQRTLSVPTDDNLVQERLRMLRQPIVLFAEGKHSIPLENYLFVAPFCFQL